MIEEGVRVNRNVLNKEQFIKQLKKKLVEEAKEVQESNNREEVIKELADVSEVIKAIIKEMSLEPQMIEEERQIKANENGTFCPKCYVNFIEVASDNKEVISYLESKNRPYKFIKGINE